MGNRESYLEFISSESYKNQIDVWYKAHNISREKIEFFHDFLISLYDLVNETYLGPDVVITEEDQRNHFTWCWDKVIENTSKEKIYFKDRGNFYEYFWNFFLEAYYYQMIDNKTVRIVEYFNVLFKFNHRKTRSELDMLSEIYKLFDQNLKK
jgi:hypothetical protein